MAEPFFDHFPSLDNANGVNQWRWPIFYPLGAALRRRIVDRIGRATIPAELVAFPTFRGGGHGQPWMEYRNGNLDGLGPTTTDRNLPISMIVNHEMLKEMLVTDWRPANRW
jgi:hypothetical protein